MYTKKAKNFFNRSTTLLGQISGQGIAQKNINAIHKRIFPKGYCISNDPQYVLNGTYLYLNFPSAFSLFAIEHEIDLLKLDLFVSNFSNPVPMFTMNNLQRDGESRLRAAAVV